MVKTTFSTFTKTRNKVAFPFNLTRQKHLISKWKKSNSDRKAEPPENQRPLFPPPSDISVSALQDTQKLVGYRQIKPNLKKNPGKKQVFNQCQFRTASRRQTTSTSSQISDDTDTSWEGVAKNIQDFSSETTFSARLLYAWINNYYGLHLFYLICVCLSHKQLSVVLFRPLSCILAADYHSFRALHSSPLW